MSLFDDFIGLFAPHYCLSCGIEGQLLCPECDKKHQPIPERCYRCRKLTPSWRTCKSCRSSSHIRILIPCLIYAGEPKELVWRLKFHGAKAASKIIANRMARSLRPGEAYLVPVPTATSRVRRRGYDQAKLIARELSRISGLPYLDCLSRGGQAHQVGASRTVRLQQLSKAYRVKKPLLISGRNIILVDDVVTTGATIEAAATVLRSAGARRVDALVYAQP
jgi:competence protein ComFC